jgi:signal transduction histidine kinase
MSSAYATITHNMPGSPFKKLHTSELEHQQLTSLVNSMVDGFIAVDERIKVTMYNGAALNILDLNDSISRMSLDTVVKPLETQIYRWQYHQFVPECGTCPPRLWKKG